MDIIIIDSTLHEKGAIDIDIDIEIGTSEATNDFEITCEPIDGAYGFYIPGTEYGGIIEKTKEKTNAQDETICGWTWRGLLTQSIIIPPSGSDYMVVSGDANTIISTLLADVLGGFFTVPSTASGCTITNYQFPLYIKTLDGIEGMLEEYGYRLSIHADKPSSGAAVEITVEAVEATQISGSENEDSPYTITMTINHMGINHLVCMGKGELQERQRKDLYIQANGSVGTTQCYTGFAERIAYYDYSNAESEDELTKHGTERLIEIASSISVEVATSDEYDAEIGDVVQAAVRGIVVQTPIIKKIVKVKQGEITTELKTREVQ